MKNRVLRLAVVAILVFAMTLTMAACAAPAVPNVENPTGPQAPAPAPTEDTKTPSEAPKLEDTTGNTPAPGSDEEALKNRFGITVSATGGTFSTVKDAGTVKIDLGTLDTDRYHVTWRLDSIDYDGGSTNPNKGTLQSAFNSNSDSDTTKTFTVTNAGTYTVEIVVTVLDMGVDFGFFGIPRAEDPEEFVITKTFEIKKQEYTISIDDYYGKIGSTEFVGVTEAVDKLIDGNAKILALTLADDSGAEAALKAVIGTKGTLYLVTPDYSKTTPGTVARSIVYAKNGLSTDGGKLATIDEDDLLEFEELEVANYTYKFDAGSLNLLSAYEWNEVGDVITSAMDIEDVKIDESGAIVSNDGASAVYPAIALTEQYALALNRYEALNNAQKVFLKNIADFTDSGLGFASDTSIISTGKAYKNSTIKKSATANYEEAEMVKGEALVAWLTGEIKDAYDAEQARLANVKAWEEIVKAAEWDRYGKAPFNAGDDFAMESFNTIDAWVKANTSAVKSLGFVNNSGDVRGKDDDYDNYIDAKAAISRNKVNAVTDLFKGAIAAYEKAVANNEFTYYIYEGIYYIDNSDVNYVVKYALDAYNALTTAEKASVDADSTIAFADSYPGKAAADAALTVAPASAPLPSAIIKALNGISKVIASMKQITEYVNIENFSKKESDIYAILQKLVYGKEDDGEGNYTVDITEDFFGFDGETAHNGHAHASKVLHFAMADLVEYVNDDEVRAAVVAEYKAWIDAVVAFEAVKEAAVDAFETAFEEYVVDRELTASVERRAEEGKEAIALYIMGAVDAEDATIAQIIENVTTFKGIRYASVTDILARNVESVEEVKEYFEDAFDGESIAKNLTWNKTAGTDGTGRWTSEDYDS